MSEVQKLSLLDQLKMQHAQFISQRDQAQANLNQLIGAVIACEMVIKKHEEEKSQSEDSLGEKVNGDSDNKEQEQAA